jgi:hypothetical protein
LSSKEKVEVIAVPLAFRGGESLAWFGFKHFQVCINRQECYGFGPGHPGKLEARRQGDTFEVEVANVEAVKSTINGYKGTYFPGANDCQTAVMESLKNGGADKQDVEKVSRMANFSLQSEERGKEYEKFFYEYGGSS